MKLSIALLSLVLTAGLSLATAASVPHDSFQARSTTSGAHHHKAKHHRAKHKHHA